MTEALTAMPSCCNLALQGNAQKLSQLLSLNLPRSPAHHRPCLCLTPTCVCVCPSGSPSPVTGLSIAQPVDAVSSDAALPQHCLCHCWVDRLQGCQGIALDLHTVVLCHNTPP